MDTENAGYGVRYTNDIVDVGLDSNLGRLLDATLDRLAATGLFRMVCPLQAPTESLAGLDFPMAVVYPSAMPEEERTNADNWKRYTFLVVMASVDDNWYRGVKRMGAMREVAESALRSKERVEMKDGDMHENTLLETDNYIATGQEQSMFTFASSFMVRYEVTEPREEE